MLKQTILFISTASLLSFGIAAGCSSNSTTTTTEPDGGINTNPDSSTGVIPDGGSVLSDSSVKGGTDAGGDSAAAATCPGAVDPSTDVPPYVASTPTTGICTSQQVSDFVAACYGTSGSNKACNAWLAIAGNVACGNCVSPADSSGNFITQGPQVVESTGAILPNTPGCVALTDKTNGTACAPALSNYAQCEDVACNGCSSQTTFDTCQQATSTGSGACASYYTAFAGSCASDVGDGGIASQTGECQDPAFIFNLYCGGADGGTVSTPDAGDAGDGG
jgi:hypothetical protein